MKIKFKCNKCSNIFLEKLKEGEKIVKYPHGFMVDSKGKMDIIYCGKCKSENLKKCEEVL